MIANEVHKNKSGWYKEQRIFQKIIGFDITSFHFKLHYHQAKAKISNHIILPPKDIDIPHLNVPL